MITTAPVDAKETKLDVNVKLLCEGVAPIHSGWLRTNQGNSSLSSVDKIVPLQYEIKVVLVIVLGINI